MRLLRFMIRVWDYRWLAPLCLGMTVMLPIGIELYGYPSDAWRLFCWVLAPVPSIALFVGAYVHMVRLQIRMLERRWREANRLCPAHTPQTLEAIIQRLRNDPWWED